MPSNNICKCGKSIPRRYNSTIQPTECPNCTLKRLQASPKGPGSTFKTKATKRATSKGDDPKTKIKRKTNWMDVADTWFSRFIRVTFCIVDNGEPYCKDIITGRYYQSRNIDNGHFISRGNLSTRYYTDNCRPQNRSSNRFRGEMDKPKFEQNLRREIGEERFEALMKRSKELVHYGDLEYKRTADDFRKLTNQVVKDKGIVKWW